MFMSGYKNKGINLTLDKVVMLSTVVGFLSILYAGINSSPYLADEVFHYRLASYIYDLWAIPEYDPLLHTNPLTGKNYYVNEPLWHVSLAAFWTLTGHSQLTGQIFQGLIYLGMVFSAYLLGKEIHSKECGYYTGILVASSPFVVLYSILFHVDIFLMLLCTLCYVMILRKHFLWVGILLGLAFATKRNSYFIAPALAFSIVYYANGTLKNKAEKLLVFLLALSVIAAPELYRRHSEFGFYGTVTPKYFESPDLSSPSDTPVIEPPTIIVEDDILSPIKQPLVGMPKQPTTFVLGKLSKKIMVKISMFIQPRDTIYEPKKENGIYGEFVHPESVLKPSTIPIYLGLPLTVVLLITIVYLYKNKTFVDLLNKKLMLAYIVVPSFLVAYAICFFNNWGFRYMSPILIFAFLLGGYGLTSIRGRGWNYLKYMLVLGCLAQIITTAIYVQKYRKISPDAREAYEYSKKYIPPNHLTLSPKGAFALHAGKPVLWHSTCAPIELDYIFWKANEEEAEEIFGKFGIYYLFIDKDRIYDDSKVHHVLGYPVSFVKKLQNFKCMKLIFNNRYASIWQIKHEKG